MAAISASSGTATNTPTSTRWNVEFGSSAKSGRITRGWLVAVSPVLAVSPMTSVLLVLPMTLPLAGDGFCAVLAVAGSAGAVVALAALTVSGDVVIVLLWIRDATDRSACTLT